MNCIENHKKYRIIFMGTSAISVACLKAILKLPIELVLVITKPDKLGNHHQISVPVVKQFCCQQNFSFIQPDKLIASVDSIKSLAPDFLITCSYGKIVPEVVLKIFKRCINVHASLLPAYRGASPIQKAISELNSITGISLMEMTKELDAGKVYWQKEIAIDPNETFDSLHDKMCQNFDSQFLTALVEIFENQRNGIEQEKLINQRGAISYAPIITKEMCFIDWNQTAQKIVGHVRSLFSKPLARTHYEQIAIKVFRCSVQKLSSSDVCQDVQYEPGEIIEINRNGIVVKTKSTDECLLIEQLQLPNKSPVNVSQLINGKHIFKKHQRFF